MLVMGFPRVYRQGAGAFDTLGRTVAEFGTCALIVSDTFVRDLLGSRLTQTLEQAGIKAVYAPFDGECSPQAIELATREAERSNCDVVVGIGGGKVLDLAKAVTIEHRVPVVVVPTVASNDSPTSRLAITYEEDGTFIGPRFMSRNPDAILVDTQIIAEAPVRYFIAGIGDALVTWFEAEQCRISGADNFFGGRPTEAALSLSSHCYDLIRRFGAEAVRDVRSGRVGPAVEKVVEANTLLSGLGFEGCGVAAAHAVGMALSVVPELHGILHGEEVAVGLLTHLILEGRSDVFLHDILAFYAEIGLPASLRDLGLKPVENHHLEKIATFAARPKSRIHNMSMPIDAATVMRALQRAESLATSCVG